jgi:hypothetical protein
VNINTKNNFINCPESVDRISNVYKFVSNRFSKNKTNSKNKKIKEITTGSDNDILIIKIEWLQNSMTKRACTNK